MRHSVDGKTVLDASVGAAEDAASGDELLPPELVEAVVRLRVLESVPFEYLVPDEALLPAESIRFFYLDRNWTDALVQGLLSASAATTRDRIDLAGRWAAVREEVDRAEHNARATRAADPSVSGAAETITGFLVRSRAISGWPGVQVRAYRRTGPEGSDPMSGLEEMRLLRLERLGPAVLLALIDGVPDQVHLEEPRAGIQFGVDEEPGGGAITVALKDPGTGKRVQEAGRDVTVPVPFRKDAPGVVAAKRLADALLAADTGNLLGSTLGSAEYALQMLQLPYRQVFGETAAEPQLDAMLDVASKYEIGALARLWRDG